MSNLVSLHSLVLISIFETSLTKRSFAITSRVFLLLLALPYSFLHAQEVIIGRDAEGRITVNATRYDGEVRIDGNLDEAIYQQLAPLSNFIQQIPTEGAPASEKTEAWIYFDDDNIYVAARLYESVPESDWIANEMRRDTFQLRTNDSSTVMLDTYLDRRNGVAFLVTPIGGFSDYAIANEGDGGRGVNFDWNIVWDSRVGRFDGGWTVEMEIPFRSLRYEPGEEQTWGIQFRRIIRRLNEASYLTPLPISAARGNSLVAGVWRISEAGTLENVRVPPNKFNLEVKPHGLGTVTTNRESMPRIKNEAEGEAGVDVKFGITNNLTADFTYNTDFAQVEVDERQVNLTRFNQFFPEKREFFLEGRGNFDFTQPRGLDIPTMFFSRRIGLERGQIVPIDVGAQRQVSGVLSLRVSDFWSGTNTSIGFGSGRIELSPQLSVEPSYSTNKVEIPEGDFRTELSSFRVTYTLSPRMYLGGLVQYDSNADSFSTNCRFRWEWAPGSEFFVVYSDDRNTDPFGHPADWNCVIAA